MMERTLPATWSLPRIRLTADVLAVIGLAWFAWFLGGWAQGGDAAIEYAVHFPPDYSVSSFLTPTYNYSPAFAFWVQPFHALPWHLFLTIIIGAELACLAWLATPTLALLLVFIQAPFIFQELLEGQFNLLVAAAVVLAFRRPWLYAPLLLTKVTPGVGVLWFAVRREWRNLGIALAATLLVALPALILGPASWVAWVQHSLIGNVGTEGGTPLVIRGPVAAGLVAWGALRGKPWAVALAVGVASPSGSIGWVGALGAVKLWRDAR